MRHPLTAVLVLACFVADSAQVCPPEFRSIGQTCGQVPAGKRACSQAAHKAVVCISLHDFSPLRPGGLIGGCFWGGNSWSAMGRRMSGSLSRLAPGSVGVGVGGWGVCRRRWDWGMGGEGGALGWVGGECRGRLSMPGRSCVQVVGALKRGADDELVGSLVRKE